MRQYKKQVVIYPSIDSVRVWKKQKPIILAWRSVSLVTSEWAKTLPCMGASFTSQARIASHAGSSRRICFQICRKHYCHLSWKCSMLVPCMGNCTVPNRAEFARGVLVCWSSICLRQKSAWVHAPQRLSPRTPLCLQLCVFLFCICWAFAKAALAEVNFLGAKLKLSS